MVKILLTSILMAVTVGCSSRSLTEYEEAKLRLEKFKIDGSLLDGMLTVGSLKVGDTNIITLKARIEVEGGNKHPRYDVIFYEYKDGELYKIKMNTTPYPKK